ncbi:MAG: hypothetical protein A3C79_01400 [Candidatus Taylorbacteria bacterium RIFCSPHIGHO2_02_FULL_45_28]|uniref:Leucine-binding protein domain-containing protein n=1 Tax=Candidatus Taylorbacteria bacterium RIFCSPHIGHO2_12_FULL_45_16 TaxID=1802315 RepID=A0A1G2MYS5_9BACT|nr:MAG: hypothetical protein A2830_03565 [Candidatus Taylorbacteria bacterium RIFCSPHIGHO2_01_FULL_44_110]OHA25097.1 MAG: hypothetical protein A3C79_01400 [Candidatus Taylorbacteria bacterium RIFCSPHIGHO2_02_FULL_45_28]OHA28978.1 MAG: hypothetical protein A3F51_01785 [Candidatus Taylorbacteria bacterium RIFCSPHIGHO2_12_FULL_45_16]OHA33096.1 MAG: hypothetical protein A3A23_03465 [Candidatus Taylorbacteria bacterium RIFCSPLOWO2_01_FULL_45_59]OHA39415.1 MAG: hypothetical protein A3I98_02470 [Candi
MSKTAKVITALIIIIVVIWVIVAQRPAASETVKIGVIAPLTGARADAGEYSRNALEIAEKDINESGGKYKVSFVVEDSRYEAQTAVSALRKLIDLDNTKFIIGPYGSSEVMAAGPVAEQSQVLMIVTGAQSSEISQLGDYVFRMIHNSDQEAPIFARFVAGKMKSDTIHFLALNTAITDPYVKTFRSVIEAQGKKVGLIEKFDSKANDFRTELSKVKSLNPTDIFLIITPKQGAVLLKQANELGITAQFYNIGVEGPELLTQSDGASEGLLYPYSYDDLNSDSSVRSFYDSYKGQFGTSPDTIAANTYDAARLIHSCFEKVGINVVAVKACLYETKDYHGAGGTFSIDEKGDAIKSIFVKMIKDGKFVRYEE